MGVFRSTNRQVRAVAMQETAYLNHAPKLAPLGQEDIWSALRRAGVGQPPPPATPWRCRRDGGGQLVADAVTGHVCDYSRIAQCLADGLDCAGVQRLGVPKHRTVHATGCVGIGLPTTAGLGGYGISMEE